MIKEKKSIYRKGGARIQKIKFQKLWLFTALQVLLYVCVSLNWAKITLKYSSSYIERKKHENRKKEVILGIEIHSTTDIIIIVIQIGTVHIRYIPCTMYIVHPNVYMRFMFTSIEYCHLFVYAAQCVRKLHSHNVTSTIWVLVITLSLPLNVSFCAKHTHRHKHKHSNTK